MNTKNANRTMMRARFPYANIGTQPLPRFSRSKINLNNFVLQALAKCVKWIPQHTITYTERPYKMQNLHALAPMLIGNLANDTNGDIVIVYADAWAAAYYFVHGVIV